MGYIVRGAAPCAEFWIGPTVAGGGVSSHERWLECPLFFAVAGPCNMSEWGDRHEEESHDEGKVGSKRPRGSRGPEGKLAQKARTLRRRAERAEGHLHAEQPRYRLGEMTEQSFELVPASTRTGPPQRLADLLWMDHATHQGAVCHGTGRAC